MDPLEFFTNAIQMKADYLMSLTSHYDVTFFFLRNICRRCMQDK